MSEVDVLFRKGKSRPIKATIKAALSLNFIFLVCVFLLFSFFHIMCALYYGNLTWVLRLKIEMHKIQKYIPEHPKEKSCESARDSYTGDG